MRKLLAALIALFALSASAGPLPNSAIVGGSPFASNTCIQGGNDQYTKVLLHLDGNTTDSNFGGTTHIWAAGTAASPTGSPKFGTASATFLFLNPPIAQAYIQTLWSSDFALGSGNFTIDFWINVHSIPGSGSGVAGQAPPGITPFAWAIQLGSNGDMEFFANNGSGYAQVSVAPGQFPADTWHHVAVVRNGSTLLLFIDGIQKDSQSISGTVISSTNNLAIGRIGEQNSGNGLLGLIDEFRMSIGIARWTSNFTPPTAAYCP